MDSLITAAARALAVGDPLGALKCVALREDAPALALRGIAMAQLGDFGRARELVRRAGRAFGAREAVARARCVVAEAEIALAARELGGGEPPLDAAGDVLAAHGDARNAAHARYLAIRRLLLIGRLNEAQQRLATLDADTQPPPLRAIHELIAAGLAIRQLQTRIAQAALVRAAQAARQARIPALIGEIDAARQMLAAPAARLLVQGASRLLRLDEVEALFASGVLVVDACRHVVRCGATQVSLASRPVLFTLARVLGEAWPGDVSRDELVARAFRARRADESYRARLRVEIGRLRRALQDVADIAATERGFVIEPRCSQELVVLAQPGDEAHAAVLALLADGEAWASSALALALGSSQRTTQRALDALAAAGKVRSFGRGRARRWLMPPLPGFTTSLLLPAPLPGA
ncbi:helix-turn-helix domain-containing protein [Solimonas terrae]|uniref:Helix-turn-helix domain-containing protein n=1 Tax=Solimonas terrae TaxID=1396819 RepID=A0A6M2BUG2_9GAMM|nr:helix-turn-helix domain-containing protein [Solimonas terrae]NGY06014.1 helix-turn-helix domain-containing protein [Solimonas terrae]